MQTICAREEDLGSDVVHKARLGDMRAYDELVSRYRARAVRIARSFLRDKDLSEDIAQEAFVRTFLSIHKLRATEAFLTYLTRTIVRLCIDYSRKSSSSEVATELDPPADAEPIPVEEAIYIHGILDQLSWKLRAVIVLRDVDGMDYETIARALRIPVGTVRSRLSAARAAFKALYLSGIAAEKEA